MRPVIAVLVLSLAGLGAGCKKEPASRKSLGGMAAAITADTEVLRDANAAANEIIRATGDCEAVKAALPETLRKFDQVEAKLRTQTGRDTLAALRAQVRAITQVCP